MMAYPLKNKKIIWRLGIPEDVLSKAKVVYNSPKNFTPQLKQD